LLPEFATNSRCPSAYSARFTGFEPTLAPWSRGEASIVAGHPRGAVSITLTVSLSAFGHVQPPGAVLQQHAGRCVPTRIVALTTGAAPVRSTTETVSAPWLPTQAYGRRGAIATPSGSGRPRPC